MKINIKTSIIGSTIAAMVAFCGSSQAQSTFNVSGWGITHYGNGGSWAVTEGSPGDFTIGGNTLTSGAGWGALFPDYVTLGAGQYIELTGQFSITGGVGGSGPLRFGLFNDLGTFATGDNWTGYMFAPPTGAGAPGGAGEFNGRVAGGYASTYGTAYAFGTADANTAGTTNGIQNDTFNFEIKLQQMSSSYVRMTTSLMGTTNAILYSVGPSINNDSGGAATANNVYDAVGFYLANNGTSATQMAFTGVKIATTGTLAPIPEPASMALLGSGLLGLLMFRRRSRIK